MRFEKPLKKGKLIKRYKRFLADIEFENGELITAHCPNSGAMQGLVEPGTSVWVSPAVNRARKLPYTWEMVQVNGVFVGVNTSHPNGLVEEGIRAGYIPEFKEFISLKREVKYGQNSRIDILLEDEKGCLSYVEVKNVHLKRGKTARFPSSVTARGAKHMQELSDMVLQGHKAYVIYVVQRDDCEDFALADDIDPFYGEKAKEALKKGVIPLVYACDVTTDEIRITHPMKMNL